MGIKFKKIGFVFIFLCSVSVFAQKIIGFSEKSNSQEYDSIKSQYKKYYTLVNLKVSKDGRYAAVKKSYHSSRDTLMIMDRLNLSKKEVELIKKNQYFSFMARDRVLAFGQGEAEAIDLKTGRKVEFHGVKDVVYNEQTEQYFVLNKNGQLQVFGSDYQPVYSEEHIKSLIKNEEGSVYIWRHNNGKEEFLFWDGSEGKKVYSSGYEIKRAFISESSRHLIVHEQIRKTDQLQISFVTLSNQKVFSFFIADADEVNQVKVFESGKGEGYLVDVQRKVPEEKTIPEIWYANDGNLAAKKEFAVSHSYYFWNGNSREITSIPHDRFPMFTPTNRDGFLLAFNPYVQYHYETRFPLIDVFLYEISTQRYHKVFSQSENLMLSPKGNYMMSYDHQTKAWSGINLRNNTILKIEKILQSRPVFDQKEQYAYFESKNGLWRLNLEKNSLQQIKNTDGYQSFLSGYTRQKLTDFNNIGCFYFSEKDNPVLELRDGDNQSLWMAYKNGKFENIMKKTSDGVTAIEWDDQMKFVFSIRENYNKPSQLVYEQRSKLSSSGIVLNTGNPRDLSARHIRQEIIEYKDRFGNNLKGILYYPTGFKESNRYPMIVNIYMLQSTLANVYHYPYANPVGFDLRTLLNKGYFVYLPDIVFSETGSGESALDCIHQSLNALSAHRNIDHKNIGLTGHSMGGYETNFIATHSDRFKAYIAGSAHSDVVRAYFSYNYDWAIPYMWQFENGQHHMQVAFSENKNIYFKNNPIHFVDQVNAPILIWTGKKDENVRWDHTMEFYVGLVRNNKKAIALFYPEGYHNLGKDTDEALDLNKRSLEWWDYFLKNKKDIPWINKQIKKDAF